MLVPIQLRAHSVPPSPCAGIEPLLAGLGDAVVVAEAPPQAPQPPAAPAAGKLSLCYGGDEHTFDDVSPAKVSACTCCTIC